MRHLFELRDDMMRLSMSGYVGKSQLDDAMRFIDVRDELTSKDDDNGKSEG